MKLLLDQNLSPRLLKSLEAVYPGSSHVRILGLREADDEAVWEFARAHNFIIVSKDADSHQRSFVFGLPPKVNCIRCGNIPKAYIERVLKEHQSAILEFCGDDNHAFLAIS